jgi:hypothetical protein
MTRLFIAVGLALALALPASAQQLQLEISNGRVTLDAANVTARQILAEWARVGGTKVVGADTITGSPVTLKFVDMPERQALDIILSNVAGFIAAPRAAHATTGASSYDRILVMATSANAAQAASASGRPGTAPGTAPNAAMNGTQRRVGPPRPPNLPPSPAEEAEPDESMVVDPADTGVNAPVFTFPAPNSGANPNQPVFVPIQPAPFGAPGQTTQPTITLQPGPNGPTIYNFVPTEPQNVAPGTPPAGFGVVGSPTPGMIQMPAPGQPGSTAKPPKE